MSGALINGFLNDYGFEEAAFMSNQLRVVLIFGTYPPMKDGGADFVCNLATKLAQRGNEVYVITTSLVSKHYQESTNSNPKVLPVIDQWNFKRLNFTSLRVFAQALHQINPDVIHLIYPSSYFGCDYKLPFFIKFISRVPLVTTFFSLFKTGSDSLTKMVTLSLILCSQQLISHDTEYVRFFNRYFPFKRRKSVFIPVGNNMPPIEKPIERMQLRRQYGLDADKTYLSFIGSMDISKGVETLLKALRILVGQGFDNIRLVMVGSGDLERMSEGQGYAPEMFEYGKTIFALQKKLALSNYIIWTPYLSCQDFINYIVCSDFCVLPFRRNTLGRSSLACALELGMPIITASRFKDPLLKNGENVLLVSPDDPAQLAEAVAKLVDSPNLRMKLGQNSKKLAKAFSWDSIVSKTLSLYMELVKVKRK